MRVRLQNGEVYFLGDSGERIVSEDSVATHSATYSYYPYLAASANSPIINKSVHPIWNDLYCKSVPIKKYGDGYFPLRGITNKKCESEDAVSNTRFGEASHFGAGYKGFSTT